MNLHQRDRALRNRFRRELHQRNPALGVARKPESKAAIPVSAGGKRIILGVDNAGLPFALPDTSRALHTHIMGVPKSGKSFGMFHQIRQDNV